MKIKNKQVIKELQSLIRCCGIYMLRFDISHLYKGNGVSQGLYRARAGSSRRNCCSLLISEITINEQRELDSIKLKINDSLVNYMNKEEGVSIMGTPSSFSLINVGLSTIDLDIAI